MAVLEGLEPRGDFIGLRSCAVFPTAAETHRPSAIIWCSFGRERGLAVQQDALGNVILWQARAPRL